MEKVHGRLWREHQSQIESMYMYKFAADEFLAVVMWKRENLANR